MGLCWAHSHQRRDQLKGTTIRVGRYSVCLQEKVGNGGYGEVWKCRCVSTGKLFALKEFNIQNQAANAMYKREISWLHRLSNVQGIIPLYATQKKKEANSHFERGLILTQLCEMSLFDQLRSYSFKPSEILRTLRELLFILRQLHSKNCLHMDIKPENILYATNGSYKLCDFGSARALPFSTIEQMSPEYKAQIRNYFNENGTVGFQAPQMVNLSEPLGEKIDIWMLGCVIYLELFRRMPFGTEGYQIAGVQQPSYDMLKKSSFQDQFETQYSKFLIFCLKNMLQIHPEDRIGCQELLDLISEQELTYG